MKMSLEVKLGFEAGHRLPHYDGACSNLHGHSYKLAVEVTAKNLNSAKRPSEQDMLVDAKRLKAYIKEHVISYLDHSYLNKVCANPTAENMLYYIWDILYGTKSGKAEWQAEFGNDLVITKITLWETDTICASLYP